MFDDFEDIAMAGAAYGLYRHGQDQQTQQILAALNRPMQVDVHVDLHGDEDQPGIAPVNFLDFATADMPASWDDYMGQDPIKQQLMVHMNSAKARGARLPHILMASGYPGIGKTSLARLVAKAMEVDIIELVPPFNIYTLVEAAEQLIDHDILFIDEIHKLADNGKRGAEILLKVLEEHVAFLPNGEVVPLNNITIIGATTDRDKLPEPVVDRFEIHPYFQAYSIAELAKIAAVFTLRHGAREQMSGMLCGHIAQACRGTPRVAEKMVLAARDLGIHLGREATREELLTFIEVEPDGLTRTHIHYLTALYQYFARETKDGEVEYIIGEAAIQQILRETKQGIGRVERFLIERGYLDRTPRGRRLTELGIERAQEFVAAGKGASDVA